MTTPRAAQPQKDQSPVSGLLYSVRSDQTDIRVTFRRKYGWVGPAEQRLFKELQEEAGYAGS